MTDQVTGGDSERASRARRLFSYVGGAEWLEYRSIMAVFAGTFFAEFTPDEVAHALAAGGAPLDAQVVSDRLERLRDWGNLTVSSSVGQPSSLADYYRRRNRYLITRAGQEVHGVVEGVLSRVDEVRDVSTGRLRTVRDALVQLQGADLSGGDGESVRDLVRDVFDAHEAFADEITQFSASINQWQSRYDLSNEEFRFFAEVLIAYVAERLDEIVRLARPIADALAALELRLATIAEIARGGLAGRVADAGLGEAINVAQARGAHLADWHHLEVWFVGRAGVASRVERLHRDAITAIRTLTLNLTRLSREGLGAASRRADFVRLAQMFHHAAPADVAALGVAAFGLHPVRHLGVLADDSHDPVPTSTVWREAPRARVPLALRERGDSANRGAPSPVTDRSSAQELLRRRREVERQSRLRVDLELLDAGECDGATVSQPALMRLLGLLGRASHGRAGVSGVGERHVVDGDLTCTVERRLGATTVLRSPEGELTVYDTRISIRRTQDAL